MTGLVLESCESTSLIARERGVAGAPHGFWVSARTQTLGRGRMGRQWESLDGNLFLSIVLRPRPSGYWTWIPIASAWAVLELLKGRWPELKLSLKWPNDILLSDHKLAGILCESVFKNQNDGFVVLGLGLNVASAPQGLDQKTAALSERVSGLGADDMCQVLDWLRHEGSRTIARAVERIDSEGTAWIVPEFWRHAHYGVGSQVVWEESGIQKSGKVLELGAFGELVVDCAGQRVSLYSEEIRGFRSKDG
ncbi:MAG: biotin--[acetyl-CoA-carboxylase] ligase [Oligoflexia bacterium]